MDKRQRLLEVLPYCYTGTKVDCREPTLFMSPLDRFCYRFIAMLDGSGGVALPNGSYILQPGQVVLLDPSVPLTSPGNASFIRIAFDLFPRERALEKGMLRPGDKEWQPPLATFFGGDCSTYVPEHLHKEAWDLCQVVRRFRPRKPSSVLQANARLGNIFAKIIDHHLQEPIPLGNNRLAFADRVEDLILKHALEGVTVSQIAKIIGVHPSHLSRRFQKQRGMSPKQFLLNVRIDAVKRCLKNGRRNYQDIARLTGFSSAASLSKAFKTHAGLTPREWAQQNAISGLP